jgi:hypothetical protein
MRKTLFILLMLVAVLAACTSVPIDPSPTPEPTLPEVTPTPIHPSEPVITPTLPMSESPEDVLKLAYEDLAAHMNLKWTDITLISAEQVDFPNSCLGIETLGVGCADVITPGYRIQLQVGRSVYTYVTNLEGQKVILAEGAGPSVKTTPMYDRIVLTWSRNGGIAGFCDEIKIHASGLVVVTSCKTALRSFQLTTVQQNLLTGWLSKFGPLDYSYSDPNAVADGMSTALTLAGTGDAKPSEVELSTLLQFASGISLQP